MLSNFYSSFKTPSPMPLFSNPVLTSQAEGIYVWPCLSPPDRSGLRPLRSLASPRQVCRTMFLTCQLPGAGSGPPAMPDSQEVPPAGLSLSGPAKLCGLEGQARLFHSTQRPMCSGNSLAQAFNPPGLGSHQLRARLIYL